MRHFPTQQQIDERRHIPHTAQKNMSISMLKMSKGECTPVEEEEVILLETDHATGNHQGAEENAINATLVQIAQRNTTGAYNAIQIGRHVVVLAADRVTLPKNDLTQECTSN